MAFFVVERSASDASLSIPLPESFGSREEAIAALSAATSSGRVALTGEVFIADLSAAVPVLVMQTAPAPAMPSEPMHVDETPEEVPPAEAPDVPGDDLDIPAESAVVDADIEPEAPASEPDTAEVLEPWEAVEGLGDEPATLADALKRAATTLEDEGIVAPESIASESESATPPVELEKPFFESPDEVASASGVEGLIEAAPEPEEWPWANVESYEVSAAEGEPVPDSPALEQPEPEPTVSQIIASLGAPSDTPEPALRVVMRDFVDEAPDEPVVEVDSLIASAPAEGEDAYLPRPVILGDYAESAAPVADETPGADTSAGDDVNVPPAVPGFESEAAAGESAPTDVEFAAPADTGTGIDLAEESLTVVVETGYEATGELDLAGYSCQDCVYANTCPKVGQATPADCGSFQWRSE